MEEIRQPNATPITLEICAGNIESVKAACDGKAHRIELCTDLASGGITPSHGLIRTAVQLVKGYDKRPSLMVLIRPCPGSFIYSHLEVQIMCADIRASRSLGADGVVFGCLREDENGERTVDLDVIGELLKVVEEEPWLDGKPGSVTFHRAFDDCHDLDQAYEDICSFEGCIERVLTSGGCFSAAQGLPKLKKLCEKSNRPTKRLPRIMPGAGITADNVLGIILATGATEIHTSAKGHAAVSQSVGQLFKADNAVSTSAENVRAILEQLALAPLSS